MCARSMWGLEWLRLPQGLRKMWKSVHWLGHVNSWNVHSLCTVFAPRHELMGTISCYNDPKQEVRWKTAPCGCKFCNVALCTGPNSWRIMDEENLGGHHAGISYRAHLKLIRSTWLLLGTIKSKTDMLWMLLREGKSQQNVPFAEALKEDQVSWWLLWWAYLTCC